MEISPINDTKSAVEKYSKLVFGLALSNTGSKADADDVFQETFLAYHQHTARFNDEEHAKAWLIRTTINMSRRVTSSTWRKRRASLENDPKSDDFTLKTEEQTVIHNAINSLPDKYRIPIWLFYFAGLPTKSISKALKITDSTVRSRLARGRTMLKDILGKEVQFL